MEQLPYENNEKKIVIGILKGTKSSMLIKDNALENRDFNL